MEGRSHEISSPTSSATNTNGMGGFDYQVAPQDGAILWHSRAEKVELEDVKQWIAIRQNRDELESGL